MRARNCRSVSIPRDLSHTMGDSPKCTLTLRATPSASSMPCSAYCTRATASEYVFIWPPMVKIYSGACHSGEYVGKTKTTRSEEHTSALQSLMRRSYAVFCLKKKTKQQTGNRRPADDTRKVSDHI